MIQCQLPSKGVTEFRDIIKGLLMSSRKVVFKPN